MSGHNSYARKVPRRFSGSSLRRARRVHAARSNRAKAIDEAMRAPLAKSEAQWLMQPNRFDIPEVDTPKKDTPKGDTIEPKETPTEHNVEPRPEIHREGSGFQRRFTKYRDRQAMRKMCGTRH